VGQDFSPPSRHSATLLSPLFVGDFRSLPVACSRSSKHRAVINPGAVAEEEAMWIAEDLSSEDIETHEDLHSAKTLSSPINFTLTTK
jgi:hypothetical protein